ncbi:LRR receptor-like serine/threonine-protein kinase SIK1 [Prosopis cineraria]|uniref:LRR receptor-like serine/threonine-protein kinase SIK1 n=1 Tax=Prosopis cineraria TaxID=364024 RepID=UPI00240FAA83|nr:LRR receptor-like serine/threonine-protein kinase SIK1 [Prosopis cineraria]
MSELRKIDLSWNNFLGGIPSNMCNGLPNLQFLALQGNKLFGSIPAGWTQYKELKRIVLHDNLFTGHIPKSIGNLTMLRGLNAGSNNLEVENVSSSIGNLNALISLDLSRNHISNNIQTALGGLKNLQDLSLAHNNLQGNIPKSFGNTLSLVNLDLSGNNLSGEIPKSLESLTYLECINLSYNKLQGEIPSGGVFANLTAKSFIMNEALCGHPQLKVPRCEKGRRKCSWAKSLLIKRILPMVVSIILIVLGIILVRQR